MSVRLAVVLCLLYCADGLRHFSRQVPLSIASLSHASNQEFVNSIRSSAQSSTNPDAASILDELDFRINSFDFVTLCECLVTITNAETVQDRRHQNLITETLSALERSTLKEMPNYGVTPQSILNLLTALVRSEYRWGQLKIEYREALTSHIRDILSTDTTSVSVLSEICWCLGKLKFDHDKDLLGLISKIPESHTLTDASISRLVHGYFLLGIRWNQLSKLSRRNVVIAGVASMGAMNDQSLSSYLYAMAKMGASWSVFDALQLEETFSHIKRVIPLANDVLLSNILWSLGRLGCKADTIPHHVLKAVYFRVHQLSPLGPSTFASTVFSLNTIGVKYRDLPNTAIVDFEQSFGIYVSPSELSVSTLIYGLGCMGFQLSKSSASVQHRLFSALHSILPQVTAQGLSNILYGLAKMADEDFSVGDKNETWALLLDATRYMMLKDVTSLQATSNVVWSLGQLCSRHPSLADIAARNNSILDSFYYAIDRYADKMNEQALSNTLSGLAKVIHSSGMIT